MLPIYDLTTNETPAGLEARLDALRSAADADGQWSSIAAGLIADVRERGDAAIVEHMQQFTDPSYSADRMRVSPEELAAAGASLSGELRGAIERAEALRIAELLADMWTAVFAELGLRGEVCGEGGDDIGVTLVATSAAESAAALARVRASTSMEGDLLGLHEPAA